MKRRSFLQALAALLTAPAAAIQAEKPMRRWSGTRPMTATEVLERQERLKGRVMYGRGPAWDSLPEVDEYIRQFAAAARQHREDIIIDAFEAEEPKTQEEFVAAYVKGFHRTM